MMNKQGFTKLVFYDPQSKGLVQKCGNKCHIIISLIIENFIEKYGNDGQGRVYQNCKYNDLRDKGSCAAEWPYRDFFSPLPCLHWGKIRQTMHIVIMTKERSIKIEIFTTPEAAVLILLRHSHMKHYNGEYALFLLYRCTTH